LLSNFYKGEYKKLHPEVKMEFSLEKPSSAKTKDNSVDSPKNISKNEEIAPKKADSFLEVRGREIFRDKIAELEERVIAAGCVGDTSELDLEDSFINDTDQSSVYLKI